MKFTDYLESLNQNKLNEAEIKANKIINTKFISEYEEMSLNDQVKVLFNIYNTLNKFTTDLDVGSYTSFKDHFDKDDQAFFNELNDAFKYLRNKENIIKALFNNILKSKKEIQINLANVSENKKIEIYKILNKFNLKYENVSQNIVSVQGTKLDIASLKRFIKYEDVKNLFKDCLIN